MKIKTSEAAGIMLDWMVAKAENRLGLTGLDQAFGVIVVGNFLYTRDADGDREWYAPSTDWSQGGPIIEREGIELLCNVSSAEAGRFKDAHPDWFACLKTRKNQHWHGTTPLIAAMRCYIAFKLGDEVDVPDELTGGNSESH